MVSVICCTWESEVRLLCRTQVRVLSVSVLLWIPDTIAFTAEVSFLCAQQAEYRHGDHNDCFRETCTTVLDGIEFWKCDFNELLVYWLNRQVGRERPRSHRRSQRRCLPMDGLGPRYSAPETHDSLYGEIKNLIFGPHSEYKISAVIMINALDKCKDDKPAWAILSA